MNAPINVLAIKQLIELYRSSTIESINNFKSSIEEEFTNLLDTTISAIDYKNHIFRLTYPSQDGDCPACTMADYVCKSCFTFIATDGIHCFDQDTYMDLSKDGTPEEILILLNDRADYLEQLLNNFE